MDCLPVPLLNVRDAACRESLAGSHLSDVAACAKGPALTCDDQRASSWVGIGFSDPGGQLEELVSGDQPIERLGAAQRQRDDAAVASDLHEGRFH